jgi:hypothetical protein
VETEKTFLARQWFAKHVSAAMDMQATREELLGTAFYIQSVQNGYKEE